LNQELAFAKEEERSDQGLEAHLNWGKTVFSSDQTGNVLDLPPFHKRFKDILVSTFKAKKENTNIFLCVDVIYEG
jgi:hypothetical protein